MTEIKKHIAVFEPNERFYSDIRAKLVNLGFDVSENYTDPLSDLETALGYQPGMFIISASIISLFRITLKPGKGLLLAGIPVIISTGNFSELDIIPELDTKNPFSYICFPFSIRELSLILHHLFSKPAAKQSEKNENLADAIAAARNIGAEIDPLVNFIPTPFYIIDKKGIVIGCNNAFCDMIKVPAAKLKGKSLFSFINSISLQDYKEKCQELLDSAGEQFLNIRFQNSENEVIEGFLHQLTFKISESRKDVIGGVIGIIKRTNEEEVLKLRIKSYAESYRQSARLLLNGGIIIYDSDMKIVLAEGRALEKINLAGPTFVGEPISAIFGDEVPSEIKISAANVFNSLSSETECSISTSDFAIGFNPVKDKNNDIICGIAVLHDITDVRTAEENLRERENELADFFNNSVEALFRTDLNGKFLSVNKSFVEMLGFGSPKEIIDYRNLSSFFESSGTWSSFNKRLRKEEKVRNMETIFLSKKKDQIPVVLDCLKIPAKRSQPGYLEGKIEDISLKVSVLEELCKAKISAEEAEKMKTRFLNCISNNLGSPLKELLEYGTQLENEEIFQKNDTLRKIIHDGHRILHVIETFSEYAELNSNEKKYSPVEFEMISDILLPVIGKFRNAAISKGLEISAKPEGEGFRISAPKFPAERIITHLIDNAVKFTQIGEILVLARAEKECIKIEVIDTGIGISDDFAGKMFSTFTTEKPNPEKESAAAGMGLAIVKKYCEMYGFEIEARSRQNSGSIFRLTIKRD